MNIERSYAGRIGARVRELNKVLADAEKCREEGNKQGAQSLEGYARELEDTLRQMRLDLYTWNQQKAGK